MNKINNNANNEGFSNAKTIAVGLMSPTILGGGLVDGLGTGAGVSNICRRGMAHNPCSPPTISSRRLRHSLILWALQPTLAPTNTGPIIKQWEYPYTLEQYRSNK